MILKQDGSLYTCGFNKYGHLGDGTTEDRSTPVKIMDAVIRISAGLRHTMALAADGTLY